MAYHERPTTNHRSYTGLSTRMTTREFTTHSADETIVLGRSLAAALAPPKLVVLRGELGAGKTTLVKGVAEGFQSASADNVTRPTFTIVPETRAPEFIYVDIPLQRSPFRMRFQHLAQSRNSACGQGLDRTGGNRIDTNLAFSQIVSQIPDSTFESSLGYPHHVVVGHNFFRPVVGHS